MTQAIPMIVASGTVADKVLTDPIRGANTVNMKNTNNPEKTKEVNKLFAAIGDILTYTLTSVSRTRLRPSSSSPISRARV